MPLHVRRIAPLAVALLVSLPASAQSSDDYIPYGAPTEKPEWSLGVQLTPQLLENLLAKGVDAFTHTYKLDPFQEEEMRLLLDRSVKSFLKEHHQEMQSLADEWLEGISAPVPPTVEEAVAFGERVLPLIEKLRTQVDQFRDEANEFLNDDQQMILQGQLAMVEIATSMTETRAREFAAGGFEPERHWPGNANFQSNVSRAETRRMVTDMRAARRAARERFAETGSPTASIEASRDILVARRQAMSRPQTPDAAASGAVAVADEQTHAQPRAAAAKNAPPDDWDKYVEQVIAKYQFNDEQQQKARQQLAYHKNARDQHRDRNQRELDKIRSMFETAAKSGNKRQVELAESKYQRIMADETKIFDSLKQRLERLPTRAQRRAAEAADPR